MREYNFMGPHHRHNDSYYYGSSYHDNYNASSSRYDSSSRYYKQGVYEGSRNYSSSTYNPDSFAQSNPDINRSYSSRFKPGFEGEQTPEPQNIPTENPDASQEKPRSTSDDERRASYKNDYPSFYSHRSTREKYESRSRNYMTSESRHSYSSHRRSSHRRSSHRRSSSRRSRSRSRRRRHY